MVKITNKYFYKRRNNIILIFFIMICLLYLTSCKHSTEPNDNFIFDDDYMSLNVGDIRQFYMPYNSVLTEHSVWEVTGKTHRSDGVEVFISEWYTLNYFPESRRLEYDYIKDGYLYETQLDSTTDVPGNPFYEQRLAKIRPNDGDKWLQTAGYFDPKYPIDSIVAQHLDSYNTPAGEFKDVFSIEFTGGSKTYYAKYYGYLAMAFSTAPSDLFIVNYLKIKGREMGKYFKMDSLLSKNSNNSYKKIKLPGYLGEKQK